MKLAAALKRIQELERRVSELEMSPVYPISHVYLQPLLQPPAIWPQNPNPWIPNTVWCGPGYMAEINAR